MKISFLAVPIVVISVFSAVTHGFAQSGAGTSTMLESPAVDLGACSKYFDHDNDCGAKLDLRCYRTSGDTCKTATCKGKKGTEYDICMTRCCDKALAACCKSAVSGVTGGAATDF